MTEQNQQPKSELKQRTGAALIIDLCQSTFAWDQDYGVATELIERLKGLIETDLETYGGKIVNFTGDGFLFVFLVIENAISYCSRLIEAWEAPRRGFLERYGLPADSRFFIIRSGVEFGFYYEWGDQAVGGALNRAQRCESLGKECMEKGTPLECGLPASHFTVFITKNAWDHIAKLRFHCRAQEPKGFKGIGDYNPDTQEITETPQVIYAVWHRETNPTPLSDDLSHHYEKAAVARSALDAASVMLDEAKKCIELTYGQLDLTSKKLIQKALEGYETLLKDQGQPPIKKTEILLGYVDALFAISQRVRPNEKAQYLDHAKTACQEALEICREQDLSKEAADCFHKLGRTLGEQALSLAGEERRKKLDAAISAYQQALKVRTLEHSPAYFAITQNNLGIAFSDQADLLSGDERSQKLIAAVTAYQEALMVRTLEKTPTDYAMTQNNLGNAFMDQSVLLYGNERIQKLEAAVTAFREALKVYTLENAPADYAGTQNNLGLAFRTQSYLVSEDERKQKLDASITAYQEALKVYTLEHAPNQYAITQNNLGVAFRALSYLLSIDERRQKLDAAVTVFLEVLKVYTHEHAPADYAMTQNNLGLAYCDQANLLSGAERRQKIEQARASYKEALRVYTPEHFPDQYAKVQINLSRLSEG